MDGRPVVTIAITRRHIAVVLAAIVLAAAAVVLVAVLAVSYASGSTLPIIGGRPTATVAVRYSAPAGPSLSDQRQATSEAFRRKLCDDAWRSYQQDYNDYTAAKMAGRSAFAPSKPIAC